MFNHLNQEPVFLSKTGLKLPKSAKKSTNFDLAQTWCLELLYFSGAFLSVVKLEHHGEDKSSLIENHADALVLDPLV